MLGADLLFEGVFNLNLAHIERVHRQPTSLRARTVNVDWLDLTNSGQRQRIKHRPLRALPFEPSVLFHMAVGLRSLDPQETLGGGVLQVANDQPIKLQLCGSVDYDYVQRRLRAMIGTEKKSQKSYEIPFSAKSWRSRHTPRRKMRLGVEGLSLSQLPLLAAPPAKLTPRRFYQISRESRLARGKYIFVCGGL